MWKVSSGLFLGWSLGANDSANIFGTGVATGAVKYGTAIVVTSVFVMMGALLEGPKCMATVGDLSRLVPLAAFSCALSAGLTMTALTFLAIPASASQAIIGAIIGAGIVSGSADFGRLYKIVLCWVFTPICGIVFGYCLHRLMSYSLDRTVRSLRRRNMIFSIGIMAAGCYGAYSLGGNNVANVTGVYVGSGLLSPQMASLVGGMSIVSGVLTYSRKVMMTVGKGIAPLDPFSALVVVLANAATLHIFTQVGVPVSSSQAVVGAVVGVGLVGNIRTVSPRMLTKIMAGWLVTPVAAGVIAWCLVVLTTMYA
jgi:inorganic phosphate transporter, PiT family